MPRKTSPTPAASTRGGTSFNEAAARCRGKRRARRRHAAGRRLASMRPRPDAAENVFLAVAAARNRLASMRPRPDAAENIER